MPLSSSYTQLHFFSPLKYLFLIFYVVWGLNINFLTFFCYAISSLSIVKLICFWGRVNSVVIWQFLIDKFRSCLAAWKGHSLFLVVGLFSLCHSSSSLLFLIYCFKWVKNHTCFSIGFLAYYCRYIQFFCKPFSSCMCSYPLYWFLHVCHLLLLFGSLIFVLIILRSSFNLDR